jgi:putative mRNA 3-end processing factor
LQAVLLTSTKYGLYCAQADVYIDPWRTVPKAIITHAHSDHAYRGHKSYLAHTDSREILKLRLGKQINIETLNYEQHISINGVDISLHPAGHIIGSAQVRLAYGNEVWVVSGDYKVSADGLTVPYEPVGCSHFITESTFGLPVYDFAPPAQADEQLCTWIIDNASNKLNSVLMGYSLGKSQRLLHAIKDLSMPVYVHQSVADATAALAFTMVDYKVLGTALPNTETPCIIIVPPNANSAELLQPFAPYRSAVCSGWMLLRKQQQQHGNADAGFAISDHCDWKGLLQAVSATKAEHIFVTHGFSDVLARYVSEEMQLNGQVLETLWEGHN